MCINVHTHTYFNAFNPGNGFKFRYVKECDIQLWTMKNKI